MMVLHRIIPTMALLLLGLISCPLQSSALSLQEVYDMVVGKNEVNGRNVRDGRRQLSFAERTSLNYNLEKAKSVAQEDVGASKSSDPYGMGFAVAEDDYLPPSPPPPPAPVAKSTTSSHTSSAENTAAARNTPSGGGGSSRSSSTTTNSTASSDSTGRYHRNRTRSSNETSAPTVSPVDEQERTPAPNSTAGGDVTFVHPAADASKGNETSGKLLPVEEPQPKMWPAIALGFFLVAASGFCIASGVKRCQLSRKRQDYQEVNNLVV